MTDVHPMPLEQMELQLKQFKIALGSFSHEQQEDIQTFCRSFRNQISLGGPVARVALMMVAAEEAIRVARLKKEHGL